MANYSSKGSGRGKSAAFVSKSYSSTSEKQSFDHDTARDTTRLPDKMKTPQINQDEKPFLQQALSMDNGTYASVRSNEAIHNIEIHSDQSSFLRWTFALLLGGTAVGIAAPKNPHLPSPMWQLLSSIVGYTYFLAWSASFYPQIFMNYYRKTTRGLSCDFCVLNVLGYVCYTAYTTNFYWNERIIAEYKQRMSGIDVDDGTKQSEITVQGNDVAFAIHALFMASFTLSQIGMYDSFISRPPSRRVYIVLVCTFAFCALYILSTWIYEGRIDFLGFLYVLGTIKICVTIGKYVPQALLNRSRKSTVGWNHWNVILDFTGGVLSLLQLVGDCADMGDWNGITGNPAKIALSLVTICFDLIFLIQHYILYPDVDDHHTTYAPLPNRN